MSPITALYLNKEVLKVNNLAFDWSILGLFCIHLSVCLKAVT